MKTVVGLAAALLALSATNVFSQASIEYGHFAELKGVDKFFVDVGEDLDLRNIIKDILEKQLRVTVVDRPEDAEHTIAFRWWDAGPVWRCRAVVSKRLGPDRIRIVSTYREKETELNDLADEYAKWLVKRLKVLSDTVTPLGV